MVKHPRAPIFSLLSRALAPIWPAPARKTAILSNLTFFTIFYKIFIFLTLLPNIKIGNLSGGQTPKSPHIQSIVARIGTNMASHCPKNSYFEQLDFFTIFFLNSPKMLPLCRLFWVTCGRKMTKKMLPCFSSTFLDIKRGAVIFLSSKIEVFRAI